MIVVPRLFEVPRVGPLQCPSSATITGKRHDLACACSPQPQLTVSAEEATNAESDAELHVHAGGQGFWVCRLLEELDVDPVMCASFGGETGEVLRTLIDAAGVRVAAVSTAGSNGAYVHDRRSGGARSWQRWPPVP